MASQQAQTSRACRPSSISNPHLLLRPPSTYSKAPRRRRRNSFHFQELFKSPNLSEGQVEARLSDWRPVNSTVNAYQDGLLLFLILRCNCTIVSF